MNLKKIALLLSIFIFSVASIFAVDCDEYFSSTAISDDGEFICVAAVHRHKWVKLADGTYGDPDPECPDINKEYIWIASTKDWWINPDVKFTFKRPGWTHPAVCYDKKNDSFLVFHCSGDPSENGFYEFYRNEAFYPEYKKMKFTKLSLSSEAGTLVSNDTGIYFIQDQNLAWPKGDWFDPKNHSAKIYRLDTTNKDVQVTPIKSLEVIKIMGVPLELHQEFKSIHEIEPVFTTKDGLIIRDYDRKTWWYFNCLDDSVKHFYSKEDAQNYDTELEKQRTIESVLPEIEAKLAAENEAEKQNQSDVLSQAISKALAEALPNALPSTISETITQAIAAAIPPVSDSETSDEITSSEQNTEETPAVSEVDLPNPDISTEKNRNFVWQFYVLAILFVIIIICLVRILILRLNSKKDKSLKNADRLEVSRLVYDTQEQERASVSRDIHDSVVQDMRGIRLETELLHVNEDSISRQKKIEDMATDCVVKLRNICYNLTPAELTTNSKGTNSKFELVSIIQTLAQQFTERTKITCPVKVSDGFKYSTYSKDVSLNVFRVVQEALNNIEKHSYATKASILLQSDGKKMKIFITDDGVGFDTNAAQKHDDGLIHFGLQMMEDRMHLIGGTIKFISGNNDGTEIQLEFGE